MISLVNGYSLLAGNLIPRRRTNGYSLMLQWFSPRGDEVPSTSNHYDISRYAESYTRLVNIQWLISELCRRNGLVRINHYFDHTFLVWCEWDLRFICPKWRRILSVQYMAKQLSCRILYTWLQLNVVKLSVLTFAAIIKPLRTRWVYERALSLALGDTNLFVDDWLAISS
jgi:hypothetical protein